MPSFAATDLPQDGSDGCAPPGAGWLARQTRRMLVLAGLIAGCWLLASILNAAQASAAPAPAPDRSAATASTTDTLVKVVHSTRPVRALVAAIPSRIRTLPVTVHATVAKVATMTHQVSTIAPVIIARVVHSVPAVGSAPADRTTTPTTAAHHAGVPTRAVGKVRTPSREAGTAARVSAQASAVALATNAASDGTANQDSVSRPGGPQRPSRAPSPAQPGPAGPGAGAVSQSFGGAMNGTVTAAFAPTAFMVSAPASHIAALLRSTRERPAVSPD